jgi:hypothetical protein
MTSHVRNNLGSQSGEPSAVNEQRGPFPRALLAIRTLSTNMR